MFGLANGLLGDALRDVLSLDPDLEFLRGGRGGSANLLISCIEDLEVPLFSILPIPSPNLFLLIP
jgi:hypothetical protein